MLKRFSYIRAKSVDEAISHLAAEDSRLHAGGTDLLGCLREGIVDANKVVSISGIPELQGIRKTGNSGLRIGALTTLSEVSRNPLIRKNYTALAMAAEEVASPQLRNQGTLGGNICQRPRCWYYRGEFHCLRKGGDQCFAVGGENAFHCIFGGDGCYVVHPSDTAPALAALDARVHIKGRVGKRTLPIEKFYVLPEEDVSRETVLEAGEIVTEIELPPPVKGVKSAYRKVRARRSWDFSLAGVALAVGYDGDQVKSARVFLSGAAPVPWRSKAVEEVIVGNRVDERTIQRAVEAAVLNAKPMEQNAYKIRLFKGIMEEELRKIA
jgi:xanthine dehydrogenase YagS FAD-binding subunit